MIPAHSYKEICDALKFDFLERLPEQNVRIVGLLFARPTSPLAQKEITPNLDYFHKRSSKNVHFFCGGYGAYWPPNSVPDEISVGNVGNIPWVFSNKFFLDFVKEIEGKTNWQYGDGVELLLTNAKFDRNERKAYLDFHSTLILRLDMMQSKGMFTTVETFFGEIFRFAENQTGIDPMWGLGAQMNVNTFADALKRFFLSFLPKDAGKDVDKLSHYWMQNIGKKE